MYHRVCRPCPGGSNLKDFFCERIFSATASAPVGKFDCSVSIFAGSISFLVAVHALLCFFLIVFCCFLLSV
ncbi:hypothetical protein GCK32_022589 [Trichostrongylus colubriformis]|uniref:Transmembrane protein n=1 Tax=Trichostrongylus colubriformis TaxID=6319 RepID=A0AAN8IDQ0_TRICO